MLKKNESLSIFFSTSYGGKYKHTEVALNFVLKEYYNQELFILVEKENSDLAKRCF